MCGFNKKIQVRNNILTMFHIEIIIISKLVLPLNLRTNKRVLLDLLGKGLRVQQEKRRNDYVRN